MSHQVKACHEVALDVNERLRFQDSSQDFQLLRCVAVGMLAQLAKFLAASLDLIKDRCLQ